MQERGWTLIRAGLLVVAAAVLSPLSPVLLVFIPIALLLLAFRPADLGSLVIAVAILLLAFARAGAEPGTSWLAPRAWALLLGGAFVGVTVVRPGTGLLGRSLSAVCLALALVLALGAVSPSLVRDLDWWMAGEIRRAATIASGMLESLPGSGDPSVRQQVAETVWRWVGFQEQIYPAFLALASVAALGVAWFAFRRLTGTAWRLRPLREFRFADQLVWLLVVGLLLLVLPLGASADRIGENAAVFMAVLYLVRGLAVIVWVAAAALTSVWSAWLLGLAAVLLYPVVVGTALVLGLSDTWLDLRRRIAGRG